MFERYSSINGSISNTKSSDTFEGGKNSISQNNADTISSKNKALDEIRGETNRIGSEVERTSQLVFLGFIVLLVMVAGYVVDAIKNKKPQYIYNVNVSVQVDGSASSSDAISKIFPQQKESFLENYFGSILTVLFPLN